MELNTDTIEKTDTLFSKIDSSIKERAMMFVTSSKIVKRKETSTLKSLIECALEEYMINHPILESQDTQETQN